jgi:hypothetical protein
MSAESLISTAKNADVMPKRAQYRLVNGVCFRRESPKLRSSRAASGNFWVSQYAQNESCGCRIALEFLEMKK